MNGPFSPTPLRVLVVDDDADTTESTATLLSLYGHRVTTACDGEEALQLAAAESPDVVLSDLLMPGVNGFELARRLRDDVTGKPAVLVAVTGCASDADRRRSAEAGFDLHLVKPVEPAVLVGLLRRLSIALLPTPRPRGSEPPPGRGWWDSDLYKLL